MPAQVYTYIYTRELESSISFAVNIFQKIYNKKPALKNINAFWGSLCVWQPCGYTEMNTLWMPWPWFCRRSWNPKLARGQSHLSRRRLVLTPGSRMFDGPKKFLCSPIRFNERKSYGQVTQEKTYAGELFTWKNQSNSESTLAPFERMMHRQTNNRCSFKKVTRWNGNWSKFAKCGEKESIGNNGRR